MSDVASRGVPGVDVFPDGEIAPMATMIAALEGAGFEVRDVECLREHYALTLRAWVTNLEANWDKAVTASSAGRARIWRLYMTGSALAFAANRLGVNQGWQSSPERAVTAACPVPVPSYSPPGSNRSDQRVRHRRRSRGVRPRRMFSRSCIRNRRLDKSGPTTLRLPPLSPCCRTPAPGRQRRSPSSRDHCWQKMQ